jgi:transcriptional regulator with XRE-family HTH domain
MAKSFDELTNKLPENIKKKAEDKTNELMLQLTLAELREQRHVTQKDLAEKLHVNQSAISKIENRAGISLSNLYKLVKAMGGEIEITAKFPDKSFKLNQSLSNA